MTTTCILIITSVVLVLPRCVFPTYLPNCPDGCLTPFFLPHEICRKYWQCHNGISYEFSCMENLEWNPQLEFCNYEGSSGCNLKGFKGMSLECPAEKPSRVPLAAFLGFVPLRVNSSEPRKL